MIPVDEGPAPTRRSLSQERTAELSILLYGTARLSDMVSSALRDCALELRGLHATADGARSTAR